MGSPLLRLQSQHASEYANLRVSRKFRVRKNHVIAAPDERSHDRLRRAGFFHFSHIGKVIFIHRLIVALVERWRPETHTFHFPTGEATITLEDVTMLIRLRVDGLTVTGNTACDRDELLNETLGVVPPAKPPPSPPKKPGNRIEFTWLNHEFIEKVLELANPDEEDMDRYARAYILFLIGGFLMPEKSGNLVHTMYLKLLKNFDEAGSYSWGSEALAYLYRALCNGSLMETQEMNGCVMILQAWAWVRMLFITPIRKVELETKWPIIKRWTGELEHTTYWKDDEVWIRKTIDERAMTDPYRKEELSDADWVIAREDEAVFKYVGPIICFSIIEWHEVERVQRQFGFTQCKTGSPKNLDELHKTDLRKGKITNWESEHANFTTLWSNRLELVLPDGERIERGGVGVDSDYFDWFRENRKGSLYNPNEGHVIEPPTRFISAKRRKNMPEYDDAGPSMGRRRSKRRPQPWAIIRPDESGPTEGGAEEEPEIVIPSNPPPSSSPADTPSHQLAIVVVSSSSEEEK